MNHRTTFMMTLVVVFCSSVISAPMLHAQQEQDDQDGDDQDLEEPDGYPPPPIEYPEVPPEVVEEDLNEEIPMTPVPETLEEQTDSISAEDLTAALEQVKAYERNNMEDRALMELERLLQEHAKVVQSNAQWLFLYSKMLFETKPDDADSMTLVMESAAKAVELVGPIDTGLLKKVTAWHLWLQKRFCQTTFFAGEGYTDGDPKRIGESNLINPDKKEVFRGARIALAQASKLPVDLYLPCSIFSKGAGVNGQYLPELSDAALEAMGRKVQVPVPGPKHRYIPGLRLGVVGGLPAPWATAMIGGSGTIYVRLWYDTWRPFLEGQIIRTPGGDHGIGGEDSLMVGVARSLMGGRTDRLRLWVTGAIGWMPIQVEGDPYLANPHGGLEVGTRLDYGVLSFGIRLRGSIGPDGGLSTPWLTGINLNL